MKNQLLQKANKEFATARPLNSQISGVELDNGDFIYLMHSKSFIFTCNGYGSILASFEMDTDLPLEVNLQGVIELLNEDGDLRGVVEL